MDEAIKKGIANGITDIQIISCAPTDKSTYQANLSASRKLSRKAKYMIWGTSVPRKYAEEINEFLAKYGFTKVQLIEAGFRALIDEAAETDTSLAKTIDGYDDFFVSEKK